MGQKRKTFRYQFSKGDFVAEDIEVDATIDFTYHWGYYCHRRSDGEPPSLEIDNVSIEDDSGDILEQIKFQWDHDGEFPITIEDVVDWLREVEGRISEDVEITIYDIS